MPHWYESHIDRKIREAQEQGQFDNLPGAGKPLSDHGQEYSEDWWVRDWLRREGAAGGALPPTLAVRREAGDLRETVDKRHTEDEVRAYVAALNEQLRKARAGLLDGPPVLLPPLDADQVVAGWRERRSGHHA
ncbi:DUF1992 domain-containing protein [Actinoplanes sp. N902-109]|uniref:DnaJ family domain-containing protein n=1 Tax=Actinoplanes sp. (strain N902-109) TaxID=649831 RepID=UPI0006866913|nr:DUF1992 domain-containing protein [Actinoplanes sp. N902-109]